MSKIARATMQIFGSNAGANQIEQFGSLASGVPVYTTSIATIQALSNYLLGWFGAVVGANLPAIEDLNAICYLFAYQIAYGFQAGVPEWDSGTTYFTGSIAQDGSGNLYVSLTNTNLNNVLTNTTNWRPYTPQESLVSINPATQSPYTLVAADIGKVFLVNSANGAMQFNLPAGSANFFFGVKDSAGSLGTNAITIHRNAAESIEGVAADYVCQAAWGEWFFACINPNWFITGR